MATVLEQETTHAAKRPEVDFEVGAAGVRYRA